MFAHREEAGGCDTNRDHVRLHHRYLEVHMQPTVCAEDEEELAVVPTAEVPPSAGAQVAFDQVRAEGLAQRLGHSSMLQAAVVRILELETGLAKNQLRIR
jgi:hypothetical protein